MPRIIVLAFATAFLALPCAAAAQTADSSGVSADSTTSCAEPADSSASTPTQLGGANRPSGDTPVSGPEPVVTPASGGGAPAPSRDAGTSVSSGNGAPPLANAAQEPEPEGPGEQQPDEPGGEPQTPTGEEPATDEGGGGLPRTGLAVLQLALLGLVLVLVGARIRVIAKRRRDRVVEENEPALEDDGLPSEPTVTAYREQADPEQEDDGYHDLPERDARDEWSFPDPDEEAPTGLLPSTAIARRQARLREDEGEQE
jgi:hypothetical protein